MKYITVGLVAALLTTMYLIGSTSAGLSGDDVYRTHLVAFAQNHHLSIFQAIQATASQLSSEHGGFTPLRQLPLWVWATDPTPEIAHIVQLVFVALNCATFAMLVCYISGASSLSYIALAILFAVIELRKPHDPILGTMFLEPQVMQFVLMAIFAWLAALKKDSWKYASLALASYLCAALSDEWTYGLALIFPLLARNVRMQKAGVLFCLIPLLIVAIATALHLPGFSSISMLGLKSHTLQLPQEIVTQMAAALPTVNRAAGNLIHDGNSLFAASGDTRFQNFPPATLRDMLVAVGAGLCFAFGLVASRKNPQTFAVRILPLALGLWIFPTIIAVGTPNQWRAGLPFGEAYTLVYPAFFGVALLGVFVVRYVDARLQSSDRRAADSFVILAALTIVFWVLGNTRANALVIHDDFLADLPRNQISQAAKDDFFSRIAPGSLLALPGPYPFVYGTGTYRDADNFMYHVTGRRFVVVSPSSLEHQSNPHNAWFLRLGGSLLRLKEPQLVLARWDESNHQVIMSRYGFGYRPYGALNIQTAAINEFQAPMRGVYVTLSPLPDGALISRVVRTCGSVSVQRLFQPNRASIVWSDFTPLSGSTSIYMTGLMDIFHKYDSEVRSGAARGSLLVHRDACSKDDGQFEVLAITENPAQITVRVGHQQQTFAVDQVGKMIRIPIPASLPDVFTISLSTNANRAAELRYGPRYDRDKSGDVRMVLVHPQLVGAHE